MRTSCDTVIAILNDKLRHMFGNLSISQAFGEAQVRKLAPDSTIARRPGAARQLLLCTRSTATPAWCTVTFILLLTERDARFLVAERVE